MRTIIHLFLILAASAPAHAASPPVTLDSQFYYEIGGAESITAAPNPSVASRTIGASADIGLGYSCGKFDPTLGVSNILNDLEGAGNDLVNGAIGAVSSAIGSLPALILQRANPGLYDLFQNALIRAEAVIQLATESCEQMERKIAEGKDPFEDWAVLAKFNDWKAQMGPGGFGSSSVDVKTAKDNVEENNGANGIPWIGGANAGGSGDQPPIRSTHDVVVAGYNIILDRSANDRSRPSVDPDESPLVRYWATPDEAGQWAVEVLGEVFIRTHDGRDTETTPGHGLVPIIKEEREKVDIALRALVASSQPPKREKLDEISSDGTLITADVIRALRDLGPVDRATMIKKLSTEVAMARIMDKAVMVRRLLLTGRREPNVSATEAPKYVDESITAMDREIEDVLFQKRVRKEVVASTAAALLDLRARQGVDARADKDPQKADEAPMRDGAVSTQ